VLLFAFTAAPHATDIDHCNFTKQEQQKNMPSMRPAAMGALVLMACGLLLLSTRCQAGGVDQNPRVRPLLQSCKVQLFADAAHIVILLPT
jgi:hypothetical protein